jgi:hypothetical protein
MTSRVVFLAGVLLVVSLGLAVALGGGAQAPAVPIPVDLGIASRFAVLAGSTVAKAGSSAIGGDIGVSPGTAVMSFPQGIVTNGIIYSADAVAAQAQTDLTTAYDNAAHRTPCIAEPADLTGRTLVSGVYCGNTLGLTGTVTLDGHGNPNAVFIFQAGSALVTARDSHVALVNGAQACNVFWQVGGPATLGANSVFGGTIMALTSVTVDTGASVAGRLLDRNASVVLDTDTITAPTCASNTTTTTTAPPVTTTRPVPVTSTRPAPVTTTTTAPPVVNIRTQANQVPPGGEATAYGCGPALAYLAAYEAPGFSASCPAYSEGYQATTSCAGPDCSGGQRFITITVPCAAAYMNEASNSWVLSGLSAAPIDPFGYCH